MKEGGNLTNLAKYRTQRGFTQAQLALAAGINKHTISLYEREERNINNASAETVYRFAKALSCSMEDLLEIEK